MDTNQQNIRFVQAHGDLDGKQFSEVYTSRPKFVKFTRSWTAATGEFKLWFQYVKLRDEQKSKHTPEKLHKLTSVSNDGGS
jgi:hypothetical protein